jgi:hypothetical protein
VLSKARPRIYGDRVSSYAYFIVVADRSFDCYGWLMQLLWDLGVIITDSYLNNVPPSCLPGSGLSSIPHLTFSRSSVHYAYPNHHCKNLPHFYDHSPSAVIMAANLQSLPCSDFRRPPLALFLHHSPTPVTPSRTGGQLQASA